jgi:transposase
MKHVSALPFTNMHDAQRWPVLCSLDIHDDSSYMAAVDCSTGGVLKDCRIVGSYRKAAKHLEALGPRKRIMVIVESGPHGFAPHRYFSSLRYTTRTIATSSIPDRAKKMRKKTDRDDAWNNLQYHCTGILRYCTPPTFEDECVRDCLRAREGVVHQITRQKQQILSLTKRQGLDFSQTKTNWTRAHFTWLRTVAVNPATRQLIDACLENLEILKRQEQLFFHQVNQYLDNHSEHKYLRQYYKLIAGVGSVVSATLILEGGQLTRFRHPKPVMIFSGLIPGKRQTGGSDPVLQITKEGNKHFRTALICIAKFYRDYRLLKSEEELGKLPEQLGSFIRRCQSRLNKRYRWLRGAGKNANKATVAVAREMCGFLWEYVNEVIPTLELDELHRAA